MHIRFQTCRGLAAFALAAAHCGGTALAQETKLNSDTSVSASGWNQWRGPNRDGTLGGPAWPERLNADTLTPMWRVENLGPSYAGPVVNKAAVFTVETSESRVEVVRAFDRTSGDPLWQSQWEGAIKVPFFAAKNGSWVRSTPTCDGERIFAGGMRDVLVCLDAESGDVIWKVDFVERFGSPVPAFGFVSSPLVTADHVYVQAGAGFVKLDKRSGDTVWRVLVDDGGMDGSAFSSPTLATLAGREQLLVQTRAELCGVSADSGDVLWRRPIRTFRGMNILTPVVFEQRVFTSSYGGRSVLLDLAADDSGELAATPVWDSAVQGYMTSPVVIEGCAYLFTRSNRFTCIELATGEVKWTSGPTGDEYWSLVAQGKRILALANTGMLRLIDADPEAYRVVDEIEIPDAPSWAHLAVAGDEVIIRGLHSLASYRWR